MSWYEFSIHRIAHFRNDVNDWARTRKIAYMIYVMNTGDKSRMSEQKFLGLPIDEKEENERPLSMEELQEAFRFYQNNGAKNIQN